MKSFIFLLSLPITSVWGIKTGVIMVICNLFAIIIGRYGIQIRGKGPSLPINLPSYYDGFGFPELLATASFGHILGVGIILGLSNAGLLK